MRAASVNWSLYSEISGRQIDGLTFTQVKGFVACIPPEQAEFWLAWHEGIAAWAPLTEFPLLFEQNRTNERRPPPVPPPVRPRTPAAVERAPAPDSLSGVSEKEVELNDELTSVAFELHRGGGMDRRLNRRYQKMERYQKFKVEFGVPGGVFSTCTIDISIGGMLLEDLVPPDAPALFNARVSRRDGSSIQMFCKIITLPDGKPTARLKAVNMNHEEILRSWLLDSSRD